MRLVALSLAAALVATPAMAEDFAGPYVGAGVTLDNFQGSGSLEGIGFSGLGGTVFAGYDMPLGESAFAGVEANADVNSADLDGAIDADWAWGAGARLGYKLNESTALYGRVGYARTRLSSGGTHQWLDGVRYGVGLQTGLTEQLSLRAEVTQINFEDDLINNQGALTLSYGF